MISIITQTAPLLLQGTMLTIVLWLGSLVIGLCIGTIWGVARSNKFRIPLCAELLDGVTFVLRGIPFYVQLLLAYFVLPACIGINISAMTASISSLGLCSAAYISNIVRGGINSISQGQWEAAQVLGYTRLATVRYIIMPQALRAILPSLTGEFDQLLKSTAIMSTIGMLELTGVAKNIISREMNPISMYVTIAIMYLLLSSILNGISAMLERKLA